MGLANGAKYKDVRLKQTSADRRLLAALGKRKRFGGVPTTEATIKSAD